MFDECCEDVECHGNEVHAFLLFSDEPILEAAFAPAGKIGLADVRITLGREPRGDVFVFGVAREHEADFATDGGRQARDFAGASMVAMVVRRSRPPRSPDCRICGWLDRSRSCVVG